MHEINFPKVLNSILKDYTLPLDGDHGIVHWARVFEIGTKLAQLTGAQLQVVQLFALLHDSRRLNEYHDPDHGPRAAKLARQLNGNDFELSDDQLELLSIACCDHTHQRTHEEVTIQTCWDADRLDLGRVGMIPDPYWLSTSAARDPNMINWAHGRASMNYVPELIKNKWEFDLSTIE